MLSQRESVEPSPENCARSVFIKSFDPLVDKKTIYDIFSAFGMIVELRIAQDKYGTSRGYGFIQYDNEGAVKKAIDKINGILLYGKRVHVSHFIPRAERKRQLEEKTKFFTNLYVDNFGDSFTDRQFYKMFEKYGKITSYKIMTDEYGKSKGFGFVAFNKPEAAKRAVEALNGKEFLEGRPLYVGRAQKKEERKQKLQDVYKDCNLFVSNLNKTIRDDDLRKEFSRFGTIVSAKVMVNQNGRSKGFGFVCFSSREEATKALKVMKGSKAGFNEWYVSLAQRKEDGLAQPTSNYLERMANMHQYIYQKGQSVQPRTSCTGYVLPSVSNMRTSHVSAQMLQTKTSWGLPILGNDYRSTTTPPNSVPMSNNVGMPKPLSSLQSNNAQIHTLLANSKYVSNTKGLAQELTLKPLTASMLAQVPPKAQKEMLGEKILPYVVLIVDNIDLAYKITGMLLEHDNAHLLFMLEHNEHLRSNVEEVKDVLQLQTVRNSQMSKQPACTKSNMNFKK